MPIPDLNERGFLPEGVYDCTMDEIKKRFGKFQTTDRRIRLLEKLEQFIGEAKRIGMISAIVVNGSFISSKPEPNDIDLIVVLKQGHIFQAELMPFEYNVLSKKRVRNRYGFDVLYAEENSPVFDNYEYFFQKVRETSEYKKAF
jgi:hypothetical protein